MRRYRRPITGRGATFYARTIETSTKSSLESHEYQQTTGYSWWSSGVVESRGNASPAEIWPPITLWPKEGTNVWGRCDLQSPPKVGQETSFHGTVEGDFYFRGNLESGISKDNPELETPCESTRTSDRNEALSWLPTVGQDTEGRYGRGGYRVSTCGRAYKGSIGCNPVVVLADQAPLSKIHQVRSGTNINPERVPL